MLSIQEVGNQVLTGNPKSFYIFIGEEYGIKEKYLDRLKTQYCESVEIDKVSDLFEIMNKKQIISLQPKLYISRYDEDFIKVLDKKSIEKIHKIESRIVGTLICIFENSKHAAKCIKYLPDYTVSFDRVNIEFIKKYLIAEFSKMDMDLINLSVQLHTDYKSAYNTCVSLNNADLHVLKRYDNETISRILNVNSSVSDKQLRYGIASRNFAYCLSAIDGYNGQLDSLLYIFLSTMIDLEKIISNSRQQSDLSIYNKCWNIEDVYHMFMNVYAELEKSRIISTYDVYGGLIYLISLLQFSPVPKVGVL